MKKYKLLKDCGEHKKGDIFQKSLSPYLYNNETLCERLRNGTMYERNDIHISESFIENCPELFQEIKEPRVIWVNEFDNTNPPHLSNFCGGDIVYIENAGRETSGYKRTIKFIEVIE